MSVCTELVSTCSVHVTLRKCRSKRYENFPHVKCLQQTRKNRILFLSFQYDYVLLYSQTTITLKPKVI